MGGEWVKSALAVRYGLVVTVMPKVTLRKIRNFKALPFILCRN
jgi:hypothetical protein